MQLTETLVAVSIFAMPLTATIQLASQRQATDPTEMSRQELLSAVDADRLALQGAWMLIKPVTCSTKREVLPMKTAASSVSVPAGLQRQITYLNDGAVSTVEGQALAVSWRSSRSGELLRQRIYTPMGVGLCS